MPIAPSEPNTFFASVLTAFHHFPYLSPRRRSQFAIYPKRPGQAAVFPNRQRQSVAGK